MSRCKKLTALALITPLLMTSVVTAQERYQMRETENGIIRLDTQTGSVSLCTFEDKDLVCRTAKDDLAVYEEEIKRLEDENQALKSGPSGSGDDMGLPSEEEIEKTVSVMESFMTALMKAMKRLQENIEDIETDTAP